MGAFSARLSIPDDDGQLIAGMPVERLEFHFDNWRRWMRRDDVTDGYPGKAAGCVGGGYSQTFDDMADAQDVRVAKVVDALVNSLTTLERAAIYHQYLYAVFRSGRGELEKALERGRYRIAAWLVIRGVY